MSATSTPALVTCVSQQMLSVCEKRRRGSVLPDAEQQDADQAVDRTGDDNQQQTEVDSLHLGSAEEAFDRVPGDDHRRQHDHPAFERRRQELRLAVTVGMFIVRRLMCEKKRICLRRSTQ